MNKYPLYFVVLLLCSCMSGGEHKQSEMADGEHHRFTKENHDIIASNLVNTLKQLTAIPPLGTTVQLQEAVTHFGVVLHDSLLEAGYGQQIVEGDIGENLLRYRAANSETELGYQTLFRVEVGDHFVEREYKIIDAELLPASPFRVSGSKNDMTLNDELFYEGFGKGTDSFVIAKREGVPEIKLFTVSNTGVPQYNIVEPPKTPDLLLPKNLLNRPTEVINTYKNNTSNYVNLFSGFDGATNLTLIFPNDSLRLGSKNKQEIEILAKSFDPESELFSVLGCSQGATNLDNGNQYLAVGRAKRVTEELIANGVNPGNIFDEGCWGPEHAVDELPTRGVVLSRKRRSVK